MYLVRFIRKDLQQDEEYYYNMLQDAQKHLNLFMEDVSGLYQRIELLKTAGGLETILDVIRF